MSRVSRANYERYVRVLKTPPGERNLAECYVLDDWAQSIPLLGEQLSILLRSINHLVDAA